MFSAMRTPSRLTAPVLDAHLLAGRVVDLVTTCSAGEFAYPAYARCLPALRCLPSGLRTLVVKLSGMDDAVQDFMARQRNDGGGAK